MRRLILFAILSVLTLSCNKAMSSEGEEIVLHLRQEGHIDAEVTKATAVTSVPSSLYWGAVWNNGGTETAAYDRGATSVTSNTLYTGVYRAYSPNSYKYYVSNMDLSVGSNTTVWASNSYDVVCGNSDYTTSAGVGITMYHVFARTGSVSVSATYGALTGVSYYISGGEGTAGTYNLRTGAWSDKQAFGGSYFDGSSNLYLIPGTYTVGVYATYTRGDYQYSGWKYGSVYLYGGYVNNMNISWPDSGTEIVITCSVAGWSSTGVSTDLS